MASVINTHNYTHVHVLYTYHASAVYLLNIFIGNHDILAASLNTVRRCHCSWCIYTVWHGFVNFPPFKIIITHNISNEPIVIALALLDVLLKCCH